MYTLFRPNIDLSLTTRRLDTTTLSSVSLRPVVATTVEEGSRDDGSVTLHALESKNADSLIRCNSIVQPTSPIAHWRNFTMSKNERKTALSVIALMVAFGSASWAQQTQPAASQGQPQAQQTQPAATKGPMTLRKLFTRADKDGDGKVTKDEAKGPLPITYASFEQIDTDKRGWISFDQFMAFTNKRVNKQADDILTQWDKY
jgi:hypothetical protein